MKSKIMTMSAVLIFLTLIQVVVGPTYSKGKITNLSNDDIQKLLNKGENAQAINEIVELFKTNPDEANQRIQALKKKRISNEMKWLLLQLAKAPSTTYNILLRPALLELHNKLEKESTTYKTFIRPVRNLIEGAGYAILRFVGGTLATTAELTQLINNLLQQGTTVYYGETAHEKTFQKISGSAEKVKDFGEMLIADSKIGFDNIRERERQRTNDSPNTGASSPNQDGVQSAKAT